MVNMNARFVVLVSHAVQYKANTQQLSFLPVLTASLYILNYSLHAQMQRCRDLAIFVLTTDDLMIDISQWMTMIPKGRSLVHEGNYMYWAWRECALYPPPLDPPL